MYTVTSVSCYTGEKLISASPPPVLDYVLAQHMNAMTKCTLKLFRQHVVETRVVLEKKALQTRSKSNIQNYS